jgi:hypothetical protein
MCLSLDVLAILDCQSRDRAKIEESARRGTQEKRGLYLGSPQLKEGDERKEQKLYEILRSLDASVRANYPSVDAKGSAIRSSVARTSMVGDDHAGARAIL